MGGLKRWNGSAWNPVKRWSGTAWDPVKVWNGSTWMPEAAPSGPSVVGSSYVNQASASTSLTMALPTGLEDGDRLYIAAICTDTNAGVTLTETLPAGWSAVTSLANAGTMQRALYSATWPVAAPSWALSASRKSAYVCVAIRSANPLQEAHADGGGLTSTAPGIASAPAGLGLRLYVRKDNLSGSVTPPEGATEVVKSLGVAGGPSAHVLAYTTPQTSAGAMAAAATTWPITSVNSTAWTIAV